MVGKPKSKGFHRRTLCQEIKSILQQYPDDGQIFKEIIQNAEDAGASEVIFIYDKNDHRGKNRKLSYKSLDKYQGPCLYTYNDGRFEKDDWLGISSLGISRKVKDPLKVGRFGLGFKSVFHLTDMPCVTSGSKMVYLDPLKSVFTESDGIAEYELDDPDYEELLRDFDDFECFRKLGERYWCNGVTDGSLFRFSLRQEASEFSSVCYDYERFDMLTDKFLNEAYLPLIFLKNIKQIKMYVIEKDTDTLEQIYSISLSTKSQVHEQRRQFCQDIKERVEEKQFNQILRLDNEVHLSQNFKETRTQFSYIVSELFGYDGDNVRFFEMMQDEELSYVPLIAVALPKGDTKDVGGHIFSALPLPLTKERMTGMPVHVNGFFALGQDRKDLKWSTLTEGDVSNDKTVNWNKCLIQELLPQVYANLITTMVAKNQSAAECYSAWPIRVDVDQKWHMFLERFYAKMFQSKVVYVDASSEWVSIENTVFIRREDFNTTDDFKAVRGFMEMCFGNIAAIPKEILCNYETAAKIASHQVTCDWIKEFQAKYRDLSISDKAAVLSYANKAASGLESLLGLHLFPLANGKIPAPFSNNKAAQVYLLVLEDSIKQLLPTNQFLIDSNLFNGADELLESLKSWISKGQCNIRLIDSHQATVEAIKLSLPASWNDDTSMEMIPWPDPLVNEHWLKSILQFSGQLRSDIVLLEQIPMVPVICNGNKFIKKLSRTELPVLVHYGEDQMSLCIQSLVQVCGISFADCDQMCKEDIDQLYSHGYLHAPKSSSMVEILVRCHQKVGFGAFVKYMGVSVELKQELCNVFVGFHGTVPDFLARLPLFCVHKTEAEFLSGEDCLLVEVDDIPSVWSPEMFPLVLKPTVHSELVRKFGIKELSFFDVSQRIIEFLPRLTTEQKHLFFEFVMVKTKGRADILPDAFVQTLAPFLLVQSNGEYMKPSHLFEKTDVCRKVFYGENHRFADDVYDTDVLKLFGLKDQTHINAHDIDVSTEVISQGQLTDKNVVLKVEGILSVIITNRIDHLQAVMERRWVPVAVGKPSSYPKHLNWFGAGLDPALASPDTIYSKVEDSRLVGSVSYVIESGVGELFNRCFEDCTRVPTVQEMFEHLHNIQRCYSDEEKGMFKEMVYEVYRCFGMNLAEVLPLVNTHGMSIWQGHTFVRIDRVTLTEFEVNLEPYYYTVPSEVSTHLHSMLIQMNCQQSEFNLCVETLAKIAAKNDSRPDNDYACDYQLSIKLVRYLATHELEKCQQNRADIFVPVEGDGLKLYPVTECYYIEQKRSTRFSSTVSSNKILHRDLGKDIAEKFGIPSLISKVLGGKKSKFIKPWGQTEPLTLRLKRLLEEYQDGLAIIKELVQNADDAGASVVKLLYDKRQNSGMKDFLIDPGMKDWQGPALWVYNDQTFTESDFENITKINAGSKEFDTKKIGKFGLGFNSVYHLTDVPSFLSNDSLVIFDPHAVYLGEALESKDVPGIRVPLSGDLEELSSFKHQFQVFNGIFDAEFDFESKTPFNAYNGTLFRLPLRKGEMAEKSQIKQLDYSDNEVRKLLKKLEETLDHIILFTENVKAIEVWELKNDASTKSAIKLFGVTKQSSNETSIIDVANRELSRVREHSSYTVQSEPVISEVRIQISNMTECVYRHWLTASTIGSTDTFRFAVANKGHIPCGGVSVPITRDEVTGKFGLQPQAAVGKVFCFLPLPMNSNLPLHVNGAFLISRNRGGLKSHSSDEKDFDSNLANWNDLLGRDLSQAYLDVLIHIGKWNLSMSLCEWVEIIMPNTDIHESFATNLVKSLIQLMIDSTSPIFPSFTAWLPWSSLRILEVDFPDAILQPTIQFMNWHYRSKGLQQECVNFPPQFHDLFRNSGFGQTLMGSTIKTDTVYELFIENMEAPTLDEQIKDEILDFILRLKPEGALSEKMRNTRCIPTRPNRRLRKPAELIKDDSKASELYAEDDEVFPMVDITHVEYLVRLGMQSTVLPLEMIIDRAYSIERLATSKHLKAAAKNRSILLIDMMMTVPLHEGQQRNAFASLKTIKFLEVKHQPKDRAFFKHWRAEETDVFAKPCQLYSSRLTDVVSCSQLICQHELSEDLEQLLLNISPAEHDIIHQINNLVVAYEANDCKLSTNMKKALLKIYDYIEPSRMESLLRNLTFVIVSKDKLAKPKQVFQTVETEIPGFLYQLRDSLSIKNIRKLELLGVQKKCYPQQYVAELASIQQHFNNEPLPEKTLKAIVHEVVPLLRMESIKGPLHLPSESDVLLLSDALCYKDDCQDWLPDDPDVNFLHEEIPRVSAQWFGVKSLREDLLRRHPDADELWCDFGQKEELTTRIKNLLRGYSEPEDIFKEMLQNADDAGATEIEFILDKRTHGHEKIFSEKWKPLQGPALLVRNDGKFSKDDLRGIQNLGVGSKREDPLTTGKYGVGFNAVYGITDCPMLLTPVKDFDDVLCIFDPNRLYAEGATERKPGRMLPKARQFLEPYIDVKSSFLLDEIDSENHTLFRFPFRDHQMARNSKITDKVSQVPAFEELLSKMQTRANDILLFLKNISKIGFTKIDETGQLTRDEFVGKSFDIVYGEEQNFNTYQREFLQKTSPGDHQSLCNSFKMLTRKYCVQHYLGGVFTSAYHWNVVEQCGFSGIEFDYEFIWHLQRQGLQLIPKGGIAKLSDLENCVCCRDIAKRKTECNARPPLPIGDGLFCTLPLPVSTGFPAVINGNFILDYETRRDLWRHTNSKNVEVLWNNYILKGCVLPCYLQFMSDSINNIKGLHEAKEAKRMMEHFYKDFPLDRDCNGAYWQNLSSEYYRALHEKNMAMLIVNRKGEIIPCRPQDDFLVYDHKRDEVSKPEFQMSSFITRSSTSNTKPKTTLLCLLKAAYVHVDAILLAIKFNFKDAGCPLTDVSPSIVRDRLTDTSHLVLPECPMPVKETVFEGTSDVLSVLGYCLEDATRESDPVVDLEGLPLCMLADETLTIFSHKDPKFFTSYTQFFPDKLSLFIHKSVFESIYGSKFVNEDCWRWFRLPEFCDLLNECISPERLRGQADPIPFETIKKQISKTWIKSFWAFICALDNKVKQTSDLAFGSTETRSLSIDLSPLNEWSFVLAVRKNVEYLLPIKYKKHVLAIATAPHMNDILQKHGIYNPQLYFYNEEKKKLIFGDANCANDLIDGLYLAKSDVPFDVQEGDVILRHLQVRFHAISMSQEEKLKTLPLFESHEGTMRGLTGSGSGLSAVMLPFGIPTDGISSLQGLKKCVFLTHKESLTGLYNKLGVQCIDWIQFYSQYLLPHAGEISNIDLKTHIIYLRSQIQLVGMKSDKVQPVLYQMRITPFFPSRNGEKQICSEMYNPQEEIFIKMLPGDKFPAQEYCTSDWLPFLIELGLVEKLNKSLFITFAKQLEVTTDMQKLEIVSKMLCKKLGYDTFTNLSFFCNILSIKFIVPSKIDGKCTGIYPSLNSTVDRICFQGSCNYTARHLVWTNKYILPTYATNGLSDYDLNLGVITKESMNNEVAVQNLENILEQTTGNFKQRTSSYFEIKDGLIESYESVLTSYYEFYKSRSFDSLQLAKMKSLNCILVKDGMGLDIPKRAVLQEEKTIYPYINHVPVKFGQYFNFFETLGCSKKVSAYHMVDVLGQLRKVSEGNVLPANELKDAMTAVCNLSSILDTSPMTEPSETLYLPTKTFLDQKKITLKSSVECLILDDIHMESRLKKFDAPLVLDDYDGRDPHNIVNKNLLKYLPAQQQPNKLSTSIEEVLNKGEPNVCVGSEHVSNVIKNRLRNPIFTECVTRLFRYENVPQENVSAALSIVQVYVKRKLQTTLRYKGEAIADSQQQKSMFFSIDKTLGKDTLELYFGLETVGGSTLYSKVAENLLRILGNKLTKTKSLLLMPLLLEESVYSLPQIMDERGISRDKSSITGTSPLPIPGEPVPVELHDLLRSDFSSFAIDEYVAIEKRDGENDDCFYYAIFKRHDYNPDVGKRIYGLQTTENEDVIEDVAAYLVFKFERNFTEDGKSDFFVDFDFKSKDFEKICKEIKQIFENIRSLDKKARKKVLRRLYLTWHPDKHPEETKELATKVFQLIQNQLKRLEDGADIDVTSWNHQARAWWDRYREYGTQFRSSYGSGGSFGFNFYTPPTFRQANPQPQEARRWWMQANHDINASREIGKSNEWICYTAHQAAEKALKAARYKDDYQRLNSHHLGIIAWNVPSKLQDLANDLQRVAGSSEAMRYPDRWSAPRIPHTAYDSSQAERARDLAQQIVDQVEKIVY